MMGQHAPYIVAAYGLVALTLGALVVWLVADGRALERRIEALEARGIRRRSAAVSEEHGGPDTRSSQ